MKTRILIGCIIAVVVILLAPLSSVVAKSSVDNNELVEFDVEFYGLNKKHTVKLTQKEADEVELLIDEIKKNPNILRDYLSEKISKGVSLQNILTIIFLLIGLFFIYSIVVMLIVIIGFIIVILRGPPVPPL